MNEDIKNKEIESKKNNEWYSNKDLYEMINELRNELKETIIYVKKYNNLRESLNDGLERIYDLEKWKVSFEKSQETKEVILKNIKNWTPWIIAGIAILYMALNEGALLDIIRM